MANNKTLILTFALIVVSVVGLVAVGCQAAPGFGVPNGMMGNGGMMGGGMVERCETSPTPLRARA